MLAYRIANYYFFEHRSMDGTTAQLPRLQQK